MAEHARNLSPLTAPFWLRALGVCTLTGGLLCSVGGCNWNKNAKHAKGDPLLGEVHPKEKTFEPGSAPASAGVKDNNSTSSITPLQPMPATPNSFTPAALASRLQPLPGGKELAIGDGTHTGQRALIVPLPNESNALVQSASSWTASSQSLANSADRLQADLQRRGVFKYHFTPLPDGVRLNAFVQDPEHADRFEIVETTGRDAAAAFQTLLYRLDEKK